MKYVKELFIGIIITFVVSLPLITISNGLDLTDLNTGNDNIPVIENIENNPTVSVIRIDDTSIYDSLQSKEEKNNILAESTEKVLKDIKYPYIIDKTEITIQKYKCISDICGYWITATRNGREVYTNSPIWISPPPYEVVVSDVYDSKTNTQTVTIKEDPKLAAEQVLQRYVDMQPLGKAVSYER